MSDEYRLAPLEDEPSSLRAGGNSGFVRRRLRSLDTYRGLIMISLAFAGFGLAGTARNHLQENPESEVWSQVEFHFTHTQWVGCSYWDLIQPSFMFMVGVSLAYSCAKRRRLGHSYIRMFGHAAWRSILLILLGIFLTSSGRSETNWSLMNVLTQIGLGYTFLFLMWRRSFITQAVVAAIVLVSVWVAYFAYPVFDTNAQVDAEYGAAHVGVSAEWAGQHLEGVDQPWHKNVNIGHRVDVWLLNLIPREEPFVYNSGGYQTINFIPSFVTMLIGLMCGELLESESVGSWMPVAIARS